MDTLATTGNTALFPYTIPPISNISPFTYRDGMTYLELLYALRDYMVETLQPSLAGVVEQLIQELNAGLASNAQQIITSEEALHAALNSALANITKLTIDTPSDAMAYLDNIKVLTTFPLRENGEVSYIQGFSINAEKDEIYVSNQNGTELRIDVRRLSTGTRLSSKTVVTDNTAYTESLDWFYQGEDLCFIIWPKAMAFPNYYAIYNYTQGIMGSPVPINGIVRGARQGALYVTCDVWGTNPLKKFYFYTWSSIIAGAPLLVDTVITENRGSVAAKTQGIAAVSNKIIFAQGSQTEQPTLTIYDADGRFVDTRSYSRAEFMGALNAQRPGLVTNPDYLYECEGATALDGKLVTAHVVNSNPTVTADGVVVVVQHNAPSGARMAPSGAGVKLVTDWQDVVITDPAWVHSTGGRCQARIKNGSVKFRGYLTNAAFASTGTLFADVAKLPDGIPGPPEYQVVASVGGNTTAKRAARVLSNGVIGFYADVATGSWYGLQGCGYDLS